MAKLQHTEETTDHRTGEILTVKKTFAVKSKKTEDFFFTFLSGLNAIIPLSRASDIKILTQLCVRAEFNTGKVKLASSDRKDILKLLAIKPQAFTNSLSRLKEAKLLTGDRGEYEINPQYFWKGTTDERAKLLKNRSAQLLLKYDIDDFDK